MEDFKDVMVAYGQSDEFSFVFRKQTDLFQRRSRWKIMNKMNFSKSLVYNFLAKIFKIKISKISFNILSNTLKALHLTPSNTPNTSTPQQAIEYPCLSLLLFLHFLLVSLLPLFPTPLPALLRCPHSLVPLPQECAGLPQLETG